MYPVIFRLGNLTIYSYGLMMALAILVAAVAIYREAPREKLNPDHVLEAVIIAALSGLIVSRILYIILNWEYYSGQPFSVFFTRFAGLTFYGAMFGGAIGLYFWSAWRKFGFLKMADLLGPYLALGYAFGRVGCFLNGCCYGKESTVPWALPINMADTVLRHPVQLYAALGGVLIFVILKLLRPRRPFVGFIMLALFAFYGILRFVVEFFRYAEVVWLGLSSAQLFSLGLTFVSLAAIAFFSSRSATGKKRKKKKVDK
jgi:phosphatidylglycerol---prolipoprotein diacylglyceryl transferase